MSVIKWFQTSKSSILSITGANYGYLSYSLQTKSSCLFRSINQNECNQFSLCTLNKIFSNRCERRKWSDSSMSNPKC